MYKFILLRPVIYLHWTTVKTANLLRSWTRNWACLTNLNLIASPILVTKSIDLSDLERNRTQNLEFWIKVLYFRLLKMAERLRVVLDECIRSNDKTGILCLVELLRDFGLAQIFGSVLSAQDRDSKTQTLIRKSIQKSLLLF